MFSNFALLALPGFSLALSPRLVVYGTNCEDSLVLTVEMMRKKKKKHRKLELLFSLFLPRLLPCP